MQVYKVLMLNTYFSFICNKHFDLFINKIPFKETIFRGINIVSEKIRLSIFVCYSRRSPLGSQKRYFCLDLASETKASNKWLSFSQVRGQLQTLQKEKNGKKIQNEDKNQVKNWNFVYWNRWNNDFSTKKYFSKF